MASAFPPRTHLWFVVVAAATWGFRCPGREPTLLRVGSPGSGGGGQPSSTGGAGEGGISPVGTGGGPSSVATTGTGSMLTATSVCEDQCNLLFLTCPDFGTFEQCVEDCESLLDLCDGDELATAQACIDEQDPNGRPCAAILSEQCFQDELGCYDLADRCEIACDDIHSCVFGNDAHDDQCVPDCITALDDCSGSEASAFDSCLSTCDSLTVLDSCALLSTSCITENDAPSTWSL